MDDELEPYEDSRLSSSQADSEKVFDTALSDASLDFDSSLKAKMSAPQYKALRTIGAFIMRGLSLEESCVLARVVPEKLTKIMEADDDVRAFILFKQISYKASLLKTLAGSATIGRNMKSAGYLLEKQFSAEFGKQGTDPNARPMDVLEAAIEFVRENSDASPIVVRGLLEKKNHG